MDPKLRTAAPKIYRFLGRRVIVFAALSVLLGLATFAAEYLMAFSLQAFLMLAGLVAPGTLALPSWLPELPMGGVAAGVIAVAAAKALLEGARYYVQNQSQIQFCLVQRRRVFTWALFSRQVNAGFAASLFGEKINSAAICISSILGIVIQATFLLVVLIQLCRLSLPLTGISLVGVLLIGVPFKLLNSKLRTHGIIVTRSWQSTTTRLLNSIRNLLFLQISGLEQREDAQGQKHLDAHATSYRTFHRVYALSMSYPQIMGVALVVGLTLYGKNDLALPSSLLILYFYLLFRMIQSLSLLAGAISGTTLYLPQLKEVSKWWANQSADGLRGALRQDISTLRSRGERFDRPVGWSCRKLGFRFSPEHPELLSGRDLRIAPGSILVVTGPSGSGKSTLIGLLLGELAPTSGAIELEVEGQARSLPESRARLRSSVGYVGPESFIINGTIRENLMYGLPEAVPDAEIRRALEQADCGFALEMPNGLDHAIAEQGQGLSAGQKQRLALARALLRRPSALILDEATSNLDLDTEQRIVRSLERLKGQVTMIIVTHRASLESLADQRLPLVPPK